MCPFLFNNPQIRMILPLGSIIIQPGGLFYRYSFSNNFLSGAINVGNV